MHATKYCTKSINKMLLKTLFLEISIQKILWPSVIMAEQDTLLEASHTNYNCGMFHSKMDSLCTCMNSFILGLLSLVIIRHF